MHRSRLARVASDHLPVVARVRVRLRPAAARALRHGRRAAAGRVAAATDTSPVEPPAAARGQCAGGGSPGPPSARARRHGRLHPRADHPGDDPLVRCAWASRALAGIEDPERALALIVGRSMDAQTALAARAGLGAPAVRAHADRRQQRDRPGHRVVRGAGERLAGARRGPAAGDPARRGRATRAGASAWCGRGRRATSRCRPTAASSPPRTCDTGELEPDAARRDTGRARTPAGSPTRSPCGWPRARASRRWPTRRAQAHSPRGRGRCSGALRGDSPRSISSCSVLGSLALRGTWRQRWLAPDGGRRRRCRRRGRWAPGWPTLVRGGALAALVAAGAAGRQSLARRAADPGRGARSAAHVRAAAAARLARAPRPGRARVRRGLRAVAPAAMAGARALRWRRAMLVGAGIVIDFAPRRARRAAAGWPRTGRSGSTPSWRGARRRRWR